MKKITQVKSLLGSLIPLLVVAIFLNCNIAQAQSTVYFQDEVITMPNNIASFNWNSMPENAKFNNGYFGWAHFSETPTQAIQDQFAERNLKLIEYFPDQTYLFYAPANTNISFLQQSGVVSIIPIENNFKKSAQIKLNNIDSYAMQGNNVLIMLQHYDFISKDYVVEQLASMSSVTIKENYKTSSMLQIVIPYGQIDALVSQPFVKWVELVPAPAIKEDTRGRSLHRASNLDSQTPSGRNYTGAGVGVMVRDDGIVGPHIDFQGRIDNSSSSTVGQTHGDGVAGIMAGAGNLDPTKRGMAAGSDIYVTQYAATFLDDATTSRINDGSVQITNSSYGDGCNDGYTVISRTVDTQTINTPALLHVFSAGNSGTSNCGYGAGAGWGNITGGHKQGKNVIATANTFFNGSLASSSSRGPAADGRIKPDITAHGQNQESTAENNTYQTFGGTSGAAPGIAGVSAQLYEAYASLNGGAFPESGLIKATLLNTANDYGNTGPDFSFGWGMVNGLRAAMLIEDGRYLDATISQGGNNNHSITVPANTREVRFMVYWTDAAAAPGASPALVNDLDLVVTDPGSTTHQPWVLDTTPSAAFLNSPATTGADHLNNMEQVAITNPTAGTYNINVAGFNVPMGPQKYYVVYEIITDGITLTYPTGGEKFVAGTQEVIHWDANNAVNSYVLEYSTDNGATWNSMATLPPASTNYTWNVPNGLASGQCKIRITNGTLTDESDDNFSIASRVTGVNISMVCPTEVTVSWNGIPSATSYDVYLLGDKFMEVAGTSTTNSLAVPITDAFAPIWVAVVAKGGNGWETLRTNAINYTGSGLFNCPLAKDLSVTAINNTAGDFQTICNTDPIIVSAELQNDGTDPQSNFTVSYQVGSEPVVQETYTGTIASGTSDTFNFATPITLTANGDNTLRVWTSLSGDEFTNNDEQTFDFFAVVNGTAIDYSEPFDVNGVLPTGWILDNPDNSRTWQARANLLGIDGNTTTAAFVDGANYTTRGQEDTMTTEYFDLNFNGTAELTFDLAKAQWSNSFNDGLRVEISIDCGATYTQVYFKDGLDLATVPNTSAAWAPSSVNDWRTEIIDITPYVGENILVRIININDYSNSTFVDNITLTKTLSVGENALDKAIALYPNPAKSNVDVIINTNIGNTYEIELMNSIGQTISKIEETRFSARAQQRLDVSQYGTGLYFVKIKVGDQVVTKKLIVN
ncbi:S8 family serine peptidase [Kordia algicida OT-1]|uniref:Peptidase S8 and S53, subtilisin, kexin, sedolisin n=1 Tax=Kordia algicida OT-1 TaxID=391587 RepID=A9DRQ3_9FLAO|nr:S8 family serine peptidase [Kordia algicida]EDP96827.1 peptidase S8 and S53, subtilisin, kexin, sedolisin [Kordia algicida OT-1]